MTGRALLGATAALLLAASAASAEPVELKFNVFTPPQEPSYPQVMVPFAERATADSNGAIAVKTFPGGALGKDPRAQLKLVQDGVVDMAWIITSYTPGRFPDNDVFELPNLFQSAGEASRVIWSMFEKNMLRGYDDILVIGLFANHPYYIHTRRPVATLDDLKGLKIRAGGPVFGEALKALGAVPVGMPAPEIAENLSRGVLDGLALEMNGHFAFRTKDVAKNTLTGMDGKPLFGTAQLAIVMNKAKFDSLPPDGKAAIMKNRGKPLTELFAKTHDGSDDALVKKAQEDPAYKMVALSAEQQKAFDAKMAAVIDAWAAKHDRGKDLLGAVRTEIAALRGGK